MEPHAGPQGSPRSLSSSSKVKEKVQALIDQLAVLPRSSAVHKPGFVHLLEGYPDGVISCMPHPNLS